MLDRLRTYLNSSKKNYHEGVQLLYALNRSEAKRDSLTKYKSETKLATYLDEEYDKLIASDVLQPDNVSIIEREENTTSKPSILENKDLEEKRIILFKKLSQAHTLLKAADTKEERYEYMKQLVAIDLELAEIRNDIAYFSVHGKTPTRRSLPKDKDCTPDQAQIKIRLKGMPMLIAADKKLIEKLTKQLEETKFIAEIEAINAKITKAQTRLAAKIEEKRLLQSQIKSS